MEAEVMGRFDRLVPMMWWILHTLYNTDVGG